MTSLSATDKYVAVAKKLQIDFYDYSSHKIIEVPTSPSKSQEDDRVTDIIISDNNVYLAAITSVSKNLVLYDIQILNRPKLIALPRSASKIRFSVNNKHILVADKTGDVLIFDLNIDDKGTKLLGHLSLLLDILQTNDGKFIITSDRDEKIKVSCYPNTYSIQTYCLGHKEFVNHIEVLPHNDDLLVSSSGDGTLKIWKYKIGKACYTIDIHIDLDNVQLKDNFVKTMDDEGIEVETLPIVHLAVGKINDEISLLAVSAHTCNDLLIYSVTQRDEKISHKLETKLVCADFPKAIHFTGSTLLIYNDSDCNLTYYEFILLNETVSFKKIRIEKVFENVSNGKSSTEESFFESIKLLYKRKFDNVQEYLERKKQRLDKAAIKNDE